MKSKSILIENYKINTDSPEKQWRDNLNSKLKGIERKPRNPSIISTQRAILSNFDQFSDRLNQLSGLQLLQPTNGFYQEGANDYFFVNAVVYKPSNYKIAYINEITLDITVNMTATGFYTPEIFPASDFSIDFYLAMSIFQNDKMSIYDSLISPSPVIPQFINPKFTATFTTTGGVYFTTDVNKYNLQLSDTFDRSTDLSGQPIFTDSDRTKITPAQYEYIKNNDFIIRSAFGYDFSQYDALGSANKEFFEKTIARYEFSPGVFSALYDKLNIEAVFTYYGISGTYQPLQQ